MNFFIKIIAGIASLSAIGFMAVYADIKLGIKADTEACPALNVQQVADAVVEDVTRPDNRVFASQNLTTDDVNVRIDEVQIGPTSALVTFTTSKEPRLVWSAMPRCSNLKDVEYGN
ncbi:hypothetical protein HS962_21935 [Pantoea sp. BIGb0393]|uniref:Uncharacterized protein n=1 Tax=Pantoea nemavictus TaxID=2726955 RepID=A0ABU8Q0W1_9GAMM|nr:hypothetical protein [Pantoea nemavictus]MBA0038877.1 hypothetical protein [Pantoea nemavictus]